MNNELKLRLQDYKEITLNLIISFESEDFDAVDKLIARRQELINQISNSKYTKEEFKIFAKELKLENLEQKMISIMNYEKSKLKAEINKINTGKNANRTYNQGFYNNAVAFSKKV